MSWREVISRALHRSDAELGDDGPVSIRVVPLTSGPIAVSHLRQAGFDAVGIESFNIVTRVNSDLRLFVPRHQAAEATLALEELGF